MAAVSVGVMLPDEAHAQAFSAANYPNIGPGSGLYYTSNNATLGGGSSGAPWSVTNQGTVINYGSGAAIDLFSGTISNSDKIKSFGGVAVSITNGGSVTNSNSGVISGASFGIDLQGTGTVNNQGHIVGSGASGTGIYLQTGTVTNGGTVTGVSTGIKGGSGLNSVTNTGLIQATGATGVGIDVSASTTSTIGNSGTISGGANGAAVKFAAGTLTNTGAIIGAVSITGNGTLANGGTVINSTGSGVSLGGAGLVSNTAGGRIQGSTSGVQLTSGGSVTNDGTITGASTGITGGSGAAHVTNTALIQATGGTGVGIDLSASTSSTIDNSGTISGGASGAAIKFGAGTNQLIVESGSSITGNVVGLSTANNTVLFDGTGTLNANQLVNFQTVNFGSSASWTLGSGVVFDSAVGVGTGTVANNGTINGAVTVGSNGTFSNAGTVTNSAGSGVFLGGAGFVTNAAGGVIQGSTYGVQLASGGTITNAGTILDNIQAGASLGTGSTLTNQSGGVVSGVVGVLMTGAATVTNAGTITGTGGTAVQFSAAGGTLTLQTGSVLNGAVDGGGGNGSVILQGSGSSANAFGNFGPGGSLFMNGFAWTLSGAVAIPNVTVNSGALTVSGNVSGTSVTVQSGASLLGTGSVTAALNNFGVVTPGSMNSIGTLTLTGNYTQSTSGVLAVAVSSMGNASLLKITGTASLGGSALIVPLGGGITNGARYTIVTASGGVNGAFSSVSSASPLLAFSLSYDVNDVYATAAQLGLSSVGGTGNQRAVAGAFDAAMAANGSAYAASIAALDTLSAAGVHSALDRLSGEVYTGVATTALALGDRFGSEIRREGFASSAAEGQFTGNRVQFASLDAMASLDTDASSKPSSSRSSSSKSSSSVDKPWGMWLSGYGQTGRVSGDGNAHDLNETISGGVGGLDYQVDPRLRIGLAVGAGHANFSLDNDGGRGSIDQTQAALYGGYDWGKVYLNGQLGIAAGRWRVQRDVSLPGLPGVAIGTATETQALTWLESGYRLDLTRNVTLTPFAGFSFDRVWQNGVSESGAGALDLSVNSRATNSAKSELGTRFNGVVPIAGTLVASEVSLGWAHDYADVSRIATAAFSTDPAVTFQVAGARQSRDSAILGAGLAVTLNAQARVFVRYDGVVADSYDSHAVSGGVRFVW